MVVVTTMGTAMTMMNTMAADASASISGILVISPTQMCIHWLH